MLPGWWVSELGVELAEDQVPRAFARQTDESRSDVELQAVFFRHHSV
jgi:hypothetical protein